MHEYMVTREVTQTAYVLANDPEEAKTMAIAAQNWEPVDYEITDVDCEDCEEEDEA